MAYKKGSCMTIFTVKQIHPKQTDRIRQKTRKALYYVFKKYK